jgi:hypothetical protein
LMLSNSSGECSRAIKTTISEDTYANGETSWS